MNLLDKVKGRILNHGHLFLRDITNDNHHTGEELKAVYKDAAVAMHQIRNTDSLRQLLNDLINEDYCIFGLDQNDLETILK